MFVFLLQTWKVVDAYLVYLTNSVNHSLQASIFQQKLKQAEVIPMYKKLDPFNKGLWDYNLWTKTCYMEDDLTKCLRGFRKLHDIQARYWPCLEKRKRVIDNGAYVSVLSMALSKACHAINHDHMDFQLTLLTLCIVTERTENKNFKLIKKFSL